MFAFESYAGLHKLGDIMYSELSAGAWDDGLREKSRLLYHLLVRAMRGKAASIARSAERQNGAEVWKLLKEEYEPRAGGCRSALIAGLLDPRWSDDAATLAVDLWEWETAVRAYEDQASATLDPVVKCATLLRHAPQEVRHVLRLSADRLGDDYRAMC